MDFTPSSAELAAIFDRAVPTDPDVSRRKMFGWPPAFPAAGCSPASTANRS